MGGYRSGRYGGRPTDEATGSFIIDIAALRRSGLKAGPVRALRYAWTSSYDGEFAVDMLIDTRNPEDAWIEFWHATRDSDPKEIRYRVLLTATRPPFGGLRWWFVCPRTGRRAQKLFLPLGGRHFWSRDGYQLGYACQRETKTDRRFRKARKFKRSLGGDGEYGNPIPPKPKGMHWRTYERKAAQLETIETAADQAWLMGIPAPCCKMRPQIRIDLG
jgi:hypothetical protein